jgi:hypothetical protein
MALGMLRKAGLLLGLALLMARALTAPKSSPGSASSTSLPKQLDTTALVRKPTFVPGKE